MKNGHWLSETDSENMVAFCNKCEAIVPISKKGHNRKGVRRYSCLGLGWVKQPRKQREIKPGEHWLTERNDNERTAFCSECQEVVKTTKQGDRFKCIVVVRRNLGDFHENNPRKSKEYGVKAKYNISLEEYDEYLSNGCYICKTMDDLSLDHDHSCCPSKYSCGSCIRGCLCRPHNAALGLFSDDVKYLQKAIDYLKNPGTLPPIAFQT